MSDKKDPPINEMDFVGGVIVIDFGDIRVARGLSRRPYSSCKHRQLVYDISERRIWCKDCERDIEPFDAFKLMVENYSDAWDNYNRRTSALEEAEKHKIRLLATKALDRLWGKQNMVPGCPHCRRGLLPEDFKNGATTILGRDYEIGLRKRAAKKDLAP